MSTGCKHLALLALSTGLCGTAQVQNNEALFPDGGATNSPAHMTIEMNKAAPLAWGAGTNVSGLFVDLFKPWQSSFLLKPSGPSRVQSAPIPPYLLPVKAPLSKNDNLLVHEPGITLLHFSF
jgi:hypothetical protein